MNIVIVGSCTASSTLAKELNKRLSNSLIYRHDLLASLKKMPLGGPTAKPILDLAGDYLGDVETLDLRRVSDDSIAQAKALYTFFSGTSSKNKESFEKFLVNDSLNKFSKRVVAFNSASLSIINVFSGVVNKNILHELGLYVKDSVVIRIKDDSKSFLPVEITDEELDKAVSSASSMYLGTFGSVALLLQSEEFVTLFGDFKKETEVKQKEEAVETEEVELDEESTDFFDDPDTNDDVTDFGIRIVNPTVGTLANIAA